MHVPFLASLPVDPHTYALFLGAMALLAWTPGPANLFAVATGLEQGPRAALVGVLGMNAATLVWFAAAALGLGALVAAFPDQFRWVAIAGGLYVGWLGFSALRSAVGGQADLKAGASARPGRAFRDGFTVQIANPKAILFFTGVLPPFLDPQRPVAAQLAMFAVGTIAMDLISMSTYGVAGGALSARLQVPAFRRAFLAIVGVLLLAAAAMILMRH
jgi:threonine/homoserine/homoserine lactone efflux protein